MSAESFPTPPSVAAQRYRLRGWTPVLVRPCSKKPFHDEWQRSTCDQADIARLFRPDSNVGVLLGDASGGLVDVDLDCPEALAIAPSLLPETDAVFGRESTRRAHWLYVSAGVDKTRRFKGLDGECLVELRSTGGQTVFPGSIHETGEKIEWDKSGDPATIEAEELYERVALVASCSLLARAWPSKGGRHDAALALAGGLLRSGREEDEVRLIIGVIARAAGDEEVPDRIAAVRTTSERLERGEEVTGWPSLAELLGEAAVSRVTAWLGVDRAVDQDADDRFRILYSRASRGRATLAARVPGCEPWTDEINVTAARDRRKFLDALCEARPNVDREEAAAELERIAVMVSGLSPDGADGSDGCSADSDASVASQIFDIALEDYRLGRSNEGEPIAVHQSRPGQALPLKGDTDNLKSALLREYRKRTTKVPSGSALTDAVNALRAEALDRPEELVFLRVARDGDDILLDLGQAEDVVVRITAEGWSVVRNNSVLFRRTALTGALPTPVGGGSLERLRELINFSDETFLLLVGWAVAALIPDIPHPIALIGGQHGTGKSTAASMLARLVDPGPAILRSPPADLEQWFMTVGPSWVGVLDNVSKIPPWFSDALCRGVTGDACIKRMLFSDSDVHVTVLRRVIVLTSIDTGALRGDLADRLLIFDLEPIAPEDRLGDRELQQKYAELQPELLGALLDVAAEVVRVMPHTRPARATRMADFDRVLLAMDKVLGTSTYETHLAQRLRIAEEVVDADIVATAIRDLVAREGEVVGTAGEFMNRMRPSESKKGWPGNAREMAGLIRRAIPSLRELGVEVIPPDDKRRGGGKERRRNYVLRPADRRPEETVRTVRPSDTGPDSDGSDGSDGRFEAGGRPVGVPGDAWDPPDVGDAGCTGDATGPSTEAGAGDGFTDEVCDLFDGELAPDDEGPEWDDCVPLEFECQRRAAENGEVQS